MVKPLDLMALDLSGTHLIEASAGTGKTYTIASLFLRLLLEQRMPVEAILVVTYTVPATDELKTRIRDKLRQARDAFVHGASDDPNTTRLLEKVGNRVQALGILDDALARFDETAISTIHGFCQRMLKELAFETASPFETELVTDQADMVASIADDFYRMRITAVTVPEFVAFARSRRVSPEWFMGLARQRNLAAEIIPKGAPPGRGEALEPYLSAFRQAFAALASAWPEGRGKVERLICDPDTINQTTHKITRIPGYLEDIDSYLTMGSVILPAAGSLAKFTPGAIRKATKKGAAVPEHPVFGLCGALQEAGEALVAAMEDEITGLKVEFLAFLDTALARRKEKQGLVHFDDLLVRMHQALRSRGGDALAGTVAGRFKAALIDEFQDTDPLQYEIFTRCFAGSCLFFIGDPKQAIYSFRGADVFTYARAASGVEEAHRHTLVHNWRSVPGLIEAVNAVFSRVEYPFVFDWIRFEAAEPAPKTDRKTLTGVDEGHLQVWFMDAGQAPELTVEQAGRAVCRAVAFEISRLLNGAGGNEVKLGGERLKPSDMAVLVRTNIQARMVRDSLHAALIPSVLFSDENVFGSIEAFEMEVLLAALAEPLREGLVRTALMTRIFAMDASAIDALSQNEAAWENRIERFRGYHELWARFGFTPMIRRLLDGEGVRERLLGMGAGERALTNVLHIAELLGKAEAAEKLGMLGLRKWLAERRDPKVPGSDEYQLRLESDDDAVKVMTVHKSKGLEFAVVFCPFAWGAAKPDRGEGVLFHDDTKAAVLDMGSTKQEDHRVKAMEEILAENVRLLYVALTRAKNRCYVAWGKVRGGENSAMAHLMKGMDAGDLRRSLEEFLAAGSGHARILDLPQDQPEGLIGAAVSPEEPAARVFPGAIDPTWGIASYTSFIHGLHKGFDAADRDVLVPGDRDALVPDTRALVRAGTPAGTQLRLEPSMDIFSFPRGARAGTLLHEVFERIDFTADNAAVRAVVEETLGAHGFDMAWTDTVTGMVRKVLDVDLGRVLVSDPGLNDGGAQRQGRGTNPVEGIGAFRLSGIANSERLSELEFMFPLKPLTPGILDQAITDCMSSMKVPSPLTGKGQREGDRLPAITPRFTFDPVKGFLRGFMDLIFLHQEKYYLIDWKSNHLGGSVEDYSQDALLQSMIRDNYILQYHLYTVALHRYLMHRLEGYSYDEHFGGVFYVYLRGVDPEMDPEYGIFRARPDEETVERLCDVLLDTGL
ncbi:MAG: UvrD-helicase domain-containing protein [Desulfomonilia bacterium]|jgi:exodeoxyribonuclease V beta subunit